MLATDHLLVVVGHGGDRYDIAVVEGHDPTELEGFRFASDKRPRPFPELQDDLRSKYHSRRWNALRALEKTTDPAAAPLFLSVIDDPDQSMRILALQGLGRVRSPEAVPTLARLIREDPNEMVVLNAVVAPRGHRRPERLSPPSLRRPGTGRRSCAATRRSRWGMSATAVSSRRWSVCWGITRAPASFTRCAGRRRAGRSPSHARDAIARVRPAAARVRKVGRRLLVSRQSPTTASQRLVHGRGLPCPRTVYQDRSPGE